MKQECISVRIMQGEMHTEKYFRNTIKSIRNQIVFTILRLIGNQTEFQFLLNLSENDNYDPDLVQNNAIPARFPRVRY